MKVAALDLGSNTFLLLVADVSNGRIGQIYQDEIQVTKLGQGVHATKKFHAEALIRAEECLREFSEIIAHEKPQKVLAMATSAARDVSNREALFEIGRKYGILIEVIPGGMEAQLTFEGATFDHPSPLGVAVIDVGGGSTEVIGKDKCENIQGASVDVGSVRLTELFVSEHPVKKSEIEAIMQYASDKFVNEKRIQKGKYSEVIAVAGTPTTLAAVIQGRPYSDESVHGFKLSVATLEDWLKRLAAMPLQERKALVGMDPLRADVIVAGTAILISAIRRLGAQEITVSSRGVRYGVALLAAKGVVT